MAPRYQASTSYLLGNLHCPSCVIFINDLLRETFGDTVVTVSPNLVSSLVTIRHTQTGDRDLPHEMGKALEEASFEVCGGSTTEQSSAFREERWMGGYGLGDAQRSTDASQSGSSSWLNIWRSSTSRTDKSTAREMHMAHCASCRLAEDGPTSSRETVPSGQKSTANIRCSTSSDTMPQETKLENIVVTNDSDSRDEWRAVLSVGGMTCAVCSNTITSELQKHPWVTNTVVNLVGNSAIVDFIGKDHVNDVIEAIEDLGYDATLDKAFKPASISATDEAHDREMEIRIEGMFCPNCPQRVVQCLHDLPLVHIEQNPTVERPCIRVRYTPSAPTFTIRHILQAIAAADSRFRPSIHHPPTLEDRSRAVRRAHQRALAWRLMLTFLIAIPSFIIGIVYMSVVPNTNNAKQYLQKPWTSGLSRMDVSLCVLATPVYLFAADIFHVRAIKEVRSMWRRSSRTPFLQRFYKFGSMNMLISLGTSIAYISSVAQMIVAATGGHRGHGNHFYFDSVVFLTLFLLAGRLIEAYSKSKTGDAVEKLGKLRPESALLVTTAKEGGETITQVPVDHLDRGDVIKVPNGASPPADGVVLSGESSFDESSLTGESRAVKKSVGDEVYAGTINKAGPLAVTVTKVSGQSMLDHIVEVVREGQTKRAPIEQIADVVTAYFVPVITLVALLTWIVWLALALTHTVHYPGHHSTQSAVSFAFRFAIAVFVVACPCGLALAAPTAIFVGGGLAAKYGILAKGGGEAFEKGSRIDCVVFDKTGTLTLGGEPKVTDSLMLPAGLLEGIDEGKILHVLRMLEENSSHPIAKAIVAFCGETRGSLSLGTIDEIPGKGLQATCYEGDKATFDIAVGNEHLMKDLGVSIDEHTQMRLNGWKTEAKSVALLAIMTVHHESWTLVASLAVSDEIREEAPAVVKELQSRGKQVWMLSGDNVTTARAVAAEVGIPPDNVLAEVLPTEKADKISYLQKTLISSRHSRRRAMVAMVGDGINDSPALTTADVGIAIGSGSDVAISSADFVLSTSQLQSVPTLLSLSEAVLRRVRFNFGWAMVYNMIAVPVAAGALYGVKAGGGDHVVLDPVWAALAMALSSISVVVSSLSLRTRLPMVGFRAGHKGAHGV